MRALPLRLIAAASALSLGGCIFLRQHTLLRMQAQQVANTRLTVLAVVCITALPIALWAGLVWGSKTISLRSWWMLLTVECVLLGIFASVRWYFQ
jgi:hypothetical protein